VPDSDRRRPAVPSDELRRQLRERDEECYQLRSAVLRTERGTSVAILPRTPPLLVAAISAVAVLGISGGAALWNHCSSDAPLADRQVTLAYESVAAPVVTDSAAPYAVAMDVAEPAGVVQTPSNTAAATPMRRPIRRAPHRAAASSTPIRTVSIVRHPRPLSPGEFGRPRRAQSPKAD
jgi:hypothetical protein